MDTEGNGRYTLPRHAGRLRHWLTRCRSRILPRAQLHLYCVGAPKTGTHSVAGIFSTRYRAEHEPYWWRLAPVLEALRAGAQDAEVRAVQLVRKRRLELDLDLESCHALGALVPALARSFPDARFILPVREPRAWLDSMLEDQIYGQGEPQYAAWWRVYDCYFGSRETAKWPAEEWAIREKGLYPLRAMLQYWRDHHLRILDHVSPDRLLILRTADLGRSSETLARFAGVAPSSLDMTQSHRYSRHQRTGLLDRVAPDHVDRLVNEITGDLPARLLARCPS